MTEDIALELLKRGPSERPTAFIERRLDLAARAAWLYHAKGQRQDEIARELNISRQVVQRLIAMAASENLIRFQLVHPLANCVALGDRLRDRFGLVYCEIVPSVANPADNIISVATAAAFYLESWFLQTKPVTIAIGGRRMISQAARRVTPMDRPMHRLISLMGNITREGRAGHYDVILGLAERINAQCYPLPMPVVTSTVEEKAVLLAQISIRAALELVKEANALMTGISHLTRDAPMYRDGFITKAELEQAIAAGAIGDISGYCFDAEGNLLDVGYHERLTSFRLPSPATRPTLIVQCGPERIKAMRAAMIGRLANGLITDEETASHLLDEPQSGGRRPARKRDDRVGESGQLKTHRRVRSQKAGTGRRDPPAR